MPPKKDCRLKDKAKGMVADAVAVKPVSTAKYPAIREKNRDFFNFRTI
jgi:hypothetical protein